jgi:hypothetical protein
LSRPDARQVIRAELPQATSDDVVDLLTRCSKAVLVPPPRMREGEFAMGMVVAMPMGRAAVSVTPRNLIRLNPFNPRTLREAVLSEKDRTSIWDRQISISPSGIHLIPISTPCNKLVPQVLSALDREQIRSDRCDEIVRRGQNRSVGGPRRLRSQ